MARRHLLSGGSHINLSPENDDNTLGSACPILLLYIMYVSFILFRTHQQRWQIGNYSLRQWTLISTAAVYCWNEVRLSVKVTCLCVLFNSSFTVVELCVQFLQWAFWGFTLLHNMPRALSKSFVFITLIDKQPSRRKQNWRSQKHILLVTWSQEVCGHEWPQKAAFSGDPWTMVCQQQKQVKLLVVKKNVNLMGMNTSAICRLL